MRLVHKATGKEVQKGDKVAERDGSHMIVSGWEKPRSPASSGRIYVVRNEQELERAAILGQGYYPNVYDCEWIGREDR